MRIEVYAMNEDNDEFAPSVSERAKSVPPFDPDEPIPYRLSDPDEPIPYCLSDPAGEPHAR